MGLFAGRTYMGDGNLVPRGFFWGGGVRRGLIFGWKLALQKYLGFYVDGIL